MDALIAASAATGPQRRQVDRGREGSTGGRKRGGGEDGIGEWRSEDGKKKMGKA